jgi:hypothetical protein
MNIRLAVAIVFASALPAAAASDIYRCAEKGGRVSYQQMPCSEATVGERANVPTEFPEPNLVERDRLFAREADLYKRLEARRDREVQETALRDAAAERALERERLDAYNAAQQAQYVYAYPAFAYRLPRQSGMRPPVKRVNRIQ